MKSPNEAKVEQVTQSADDSLRVSPTDTIVVHDRQHEDFLRGKIVEVLGGDFKDTQKYDLELDRMLKWAKGKGAESVEDVLWEVRYLANQLGTPGYGEDRIKFIYKYIFLENEESIIREKRKEMEKLGA